MLMAVHPPDEVYYIHRDHFALAQILPHQDRGNALAHASGLHGVLRAGERTGVSGGPFSICPITAE